MNPTALRILWVVTGASALLASALVFADPAGSLWGETLGICIAVMASCMLCGACAQGWGMRRLMPVPPVGVACAVLGALGVIVLVLLEPKGDGLSRAAAVLYVLACAAAHLSLLSLAPLEGGARRLRQAAYLAGVLFATLLVVLVLAEDVHLGELFGRIVAASAILVVALDVSVAIAMRLQADASSRPPRPPEPGDGRCPTCGSALASAAAPATPPPAT